MRPPARIFLLDGPMSLFRRKSIDVLIAAASAEEHGLKKSLTLIDLIALGIGAIIGAGIFAILGSASSGGGNAAPAGPGVVVSILLTGVASGRSGRDSNPRSGF